LVVDVVRKFVRDYLSLLSS